MRSSACYLVADFHPSRPGSKHFGTFTYTRLERDAVAFGEPGVLGSEFARRVAGRCRSVA